MPGEIRREGMQEVPSQGVPGKFPPWARLTENPAHVAMLSRTRRTAGSALQGVPGEFFGFVWRGVPEVPGSPEGEWEGSCDPSVYGGV